MEAAIQDLLYVAVAVAHAVYLSTVPQLAVPGLVRVWAILTDDHAMVTQFATLQMLTNLHGMLGNTPWPIQHAMSMCMFASDEGLLDACLFAYAVLIAGLTPSFIYYFVYLSLMATFHRVRALNLFAQVCELSLVVTMYDEVAGRGK